MRDAVGPLAGLHAGGGPGVAGDRRRPRPGRRLHLAAPTSWRSSPTAPPCSASATSGRPPRCRSWRARRCCSRSSAASTPCRSASTPPTSTRSSRPSSRLAPSFGGINLEDISRPALLRDRAPAPGGARHPGLPRRPARHRDRGARGAAQRGAADRPQAVSDLRVVVSGAGAAGVAVAEILLEAGRRRHRGRATRKGIARVRSRRPDRRQAPDWPRAPTGRARAVRSTRRWPAPTCSSASPAGQVSRRRPSPSMADGRDRLRPGQPRPRGRPGRGAHVTPRVVATGRSDYPEPDQQRAGLPRHLRGRCRWAPPDHGGHEARRRRRDRRGGRRRGARGLHRSRASSTRGSPPTSPRRSPAPPARTASPAAGEPGARAVLPSRAVYRPF